MDENMSIISTMTDIPSTSSSVQPEAVTAVSVDTGLTASQSLPQFFTIEVTCAMDSDQAMGIKEEYMPGDDYQVDGGNFMLEIDDDEDDFDDEDEMKMSKGGAYRHVREFQCSVCEAVFLTYKTLVTHFRTHAADQSVHCDICEKNFSSRWALTSHMNIHNNIKPHTCKECGKTFRVASGLRDHMAKHEKSLTSLDYSCHDCGKCFGSDRLLKRHQKTHDVNHVCQTCGKTLSSRATLKSHMLLHSGLMKVSLKFFRS